MTNRKNEWVAAFSTLTAVCIATIVPSNTAHAQSSVNLYGIIDAGVTYVNNEGGGKNLKFGNSVAYGNRWGIMGNEDLGSGTSAIFKLENGFDLGTGKFKQGGAEFGREAWVGIKSPYGNVTLGRQDDFTFDYVEKFNVSAWASGYAIHQGDVDRMNGDTLNNAIRFTSAAYNGFDAGAMWSFSNTAGAFHDGAAWSAGAEYKGSAFKMGLAYTYLANTTIDPYAALGVHSFFGQTVATVSNNTATDLDSDFVLDSLGTFAIGGSYALGKLTLMGNFTDTTLKAGGKSSVMHVYEGGAVYNFTPVVEGVVGGQYTTFEGHAWHQMSLGLQYALSKRTSVYLSGDYLKASAGVDPTIGYSFAPSLAHEQFDARIGMYTAF